MLAEHTVWLDLLSAAERAHLQPRPAEVPDRPDVLIVGGGIIGLATAAACQQAGLGSVVVIERESRLGAGSTGGAAGLLLPEAHVGIDPPWFVDLFRRSLDLWRDLERAWPGGVGLVEIDWLGLEGDPAVVAAEAQPPQDARWLGADEVARLAPGLEPPRRGLLVAGQARVNPLRAASRLAAGLGHVLTGVAAVGVSLAGQRITSVSTTRGTFSPGVVVFATGNPPRVEALDVDLPAAFVKGHMLATEGTDPGKLHLPGSVSPVVTPIEEGRLLIGGSVDPDDASQEIRAAVVDRMWREARNQLKDARNLRLTHEWCCFRPWHPDSLPVLDQVPGVRNAWLSSGHYKTGILMAALTGDVLARWIASGQAPAEAARLSADRPGLRTQPAARRT